MQESSKFANFYQLVQRTIVELKRGSIVLNQSHVLLEMVIKFQQDLLPYTLLLFTQNGFESKHVKLVLVVVMVKTVSIIFHTPDIHS